MPEQTDLQMVVYTPLAEVDTAAKLRKLMTREKYCDHMISYRMNDLPFEMGRTLLFRGNSPREKCDPRKKAIHT